MSLINDALKRAGEQQQKQPQRAAGPDFKPVGPTPQKSMLVPALVALLALAIAGAGWLFWKSTQPAAAANSSAPPIEVAAPKAVIAAAVQPAAVPAHQSPAPAATVQTQNTASPGNTKPAVSAATANTITPTPATVETVQKIETAPAAAALADTAAPAKPTPPPVPQFPELKLQGISFNPSNPFALINGKTLSVGQKVSGARVTKIESDSVTLEWNGETRQLELSQ